MSWLGLDIETCMASYLYDVMPFCVKTSILHFRIYRQNDSAVDSAIVPDLDLHAFLKSGKREESSEESDSALRDIREESQRPILL